MAGAEMELTNLRESMMTALASFDMSFDCDLTSKVDLDLKIEELPKPQDNVSVGTVDRSNSTIDMGETEQRRGSLRGNATKKAKSAVSVFGTGPRRSSERRPSALKSESLGTVTPRKDSTSSTPGKGPLSLDSPSAPSSAQASAQPSQVEISSAVEIPEVSSQPHTPARGAAETASRVSPQCERPSSTSTPIKADVSSHAHVHTEATPVATPVKAAPSAAPSTTATPVKVAPESQKHGTPVHAENKDAHAGEAIAVTSTPIKKEEGATVLHAQESVGTTKPAAATDGQKEVSAKKEDAVTPASTAATVPVSAAASAVQVTTKAEVKPAETTSASAVPAQLATPAAPASTAAAAAQKSARRDSTELSHRRKEEKKKGACGCSVL